MRAGDRVRHPSLGHGSVVAVYAKGAQAGAEVDFGYMTEWVSAAELRERFAGEQQTSPPDLSVPKGETQGAPRPLSPLAGAVVDARRGVLALKLGQILEEHVLQLSTGTEKIQTELEAVVSGAVERQARSVLIVGAESAVRIDHNTRVLRLYART